MNIQRLLNNAIRPALKELEALGIPSSKSAERFLLAIALQESRAKYRRQLGSQGLTTGPAVSYLQFEEGGGVKGVITHKAVAEKMKTICGLYDIEANQKSLWEAMRYQDIVAFCAGRLLIYTLPSKLPETSEQGWNQYIDAWRPGKPKRDTWADCWSMAEGAISAVD